MTDRRAFLKLAAGAGTASLVAACGWDGGDAIRPQLLAVSRLNDWVGEKILYAPTRLARTYDPSRRSTSFPRYFVSRTMPVLADPGAWRLKVDGLVRQSLVLSLDDLMRSEEHTSELQSRLHLVCRLLLEKKQRNEIARDCAHASART